MDPEEFILNIVKEYREARIPAFVDKKISRGRSRSISSIAEDLFAYYLVTNLSSVDNILVDQAIYFKGSSKAIYPDITIVKKGVVTALVDLKTDMGWGREELLNLSKKHGKTIASAKGFECRLKDGQTKEARILKVSDEVSYSIVIISRRNSGKSLDSLRDAARKLNPPTDTFLLCNSSRYHPNEYGIRSDELVAKLELNTSEFQRLLKKLA